MVNTQPEDLPPGVSAQTSHATALNAALMFFLVLMEIAVVTITLPLLLLGTWLFAGSFGYISWKRCVLISLCVAILSVTGSFLVNKLHPHGRSEQFHQRYWLVRQVEPLSRRFIVVAISLALFTHRIVDALLLALLLSVLIEGVLVVVGKSWKPLPSAATIKARRHQASRERQEDRNQTKLT